MVGKVRYLVKYLLGRDLAGRNFAIHPDDTFLVSYPRSGNTWTRFLIANLRYPNRQVSFGTIDELIPDACSQSKAGLKKSPRPRIIKTHEYFDPRYKKVIYIVRDPRDVVLSQYKWFLKCRALEDGYSLEQFVSRFIEGDMSIYGSWGENVGSWLATRRENKSFLLLRYEDLVAETTHELQRVASFLGIAVSETDLSRAAELSSAARMREMEKKEGEVWIGTRGRRTDIPFVGGARAGSWKTDLPESSVRAIEEAWKPIMRLLKYELSQEQQAESSSEASVFATGQEKALLPVRGSV
jgi:Sulfotransferase domain